MNLLTRSHRFAERLGFSPKVFDPLVIALAIAVALWITGSSFDLTPIRAAAAAVLLALVGVAAPPAVGVKTSEIIKGRAREVQRL